MKSASLPVVFATLAACLSLAAATASQQAAFGQRGGADSFEDRIQLYSEWAQATHGRSLASTPEPSPASPSASPSISQSKTVSPSPSPPAAPKAAPATAPKPAGPVAGPANSLVIQPVVSNFPASTIVQPTTVQTMSTAGGTCKVLRYATGFANTTLTYNKAILNTPNFGECCNLCSADSQCVAWTRVAGGDASQFRNCYLKYDIYDLDENPATDLNNHVGHSGDDSLYPELRYVNEGYPSSSTPLILESGTKDDLFPADYYGCPYEPVATTPCTAPANCNVDGNGNFVGPACIG